MCLWTVWDFRMDLEDIAKQNLNYALNFEYLTLGYLGINYLLRDYLPENHSEILSLDIDWIVVSVYMSASAVYMKRSLEAFFKAKSLEDI